MPVRRATNSGIRRPYVVAVAGLVLVVSLAACGGSASKGSTTATLSTRGTVLASRGLSAKTGGTVTAAVVRCDHVVVSA